MASSSSRTVSTDDTTADETRPDERRPDLLVSGDDMMNTMDWFSTLMTVLDSPDKAFQELSELLLQDPIDEDVGLFQRRSGPQVWLVTSGRLNHTACCAYYFMSFQVDESN